MRIACCFVTVSPKVDDHRYLTRSAITTSMGPITALALLTGFVIIVKRLIECWKAARAIGNHPGYRVLLPQSNAIANILPRIRGVCLGSAHLFQNKHKTFEEYGSDIYSVISAYPATKTMLSIADASAIKEVTSSRARFPKPVHQYTVLLAFGGNIVASEGGEWKKYRKISAPAFSERNNKMVWEETVKIMESLFNDLWGNNESVTFNHCAELTLPIALFVIGRAGFGREISWRDDDSIPPGHRMSFKHALHLVSTDIFMILVVPNFAMEMTERLRNLKIALAELEQYMTEMIQRRQQSTKAEERHDLFSSLLNSNDADSGESKLTVQELIGNIFIFLLAGHETTAHTLCFTFAMLALYQDEQDKLYKQIKSVLKDGRSPTYEDMNTLTQSMAVFYETLRLFPPVTGIPKESAEDTTLSTVNASGEKVVVPVPKGTNIVLNVPGLHYNPRYWKDPESFNPDRFLGDWPRAAFLPFSGGARACLGRRFFETEGIAILTLLVLKYKIEVKEDLKYANETFEQRKARLLNCKPGLTLTPISVPLTFKLREKAF